MSTQIGGIPAARAPRAIRVGPAAAIGLALLVVGLAVGLLVGRLQTGGTERAAPNAVAAAAPATANVPRLDWRDDYATRHPQLSATAPVLSWRDDYATRDPLERGRAADAARLQAQADAWQARMRAEQALERGRAADAARWQAQADAWVAAHGGARATAPVLSWRDDYTTRHPGQRP